MREVFVLGAGASKPGGAPLGPELVWQYHSCSMPVPIRQGKADLRQENEDYKNFREFLVLADKMWPGHGFVRQWDNREDTVFLPSFVSKPFYVDELLATLQRNGDDEGIELVRRLIFEHIVAAAFPPTDKTYGDFISKILLKREPQDTSIISFNFDPLLHEDFERGVSFDHAIEFDWDEVGGDQNWERGPTFPLLKLNGSFDWGICGACEYLHRFSCHMSSHWYDGQRCARCRHAVSPFIIIPHEDYSSRIKPLWDEATRRLQQADTVTIIGYSFPDYDKTIQDLFRNSLSSGVQIRVVDVCPFDADRQASTHSLVRKYKGMFPQVHRQADICLDGFEGYLKNIV